MSHEVEYEPVSVKAVLAEMKDTAELLVDLSYSAVLLRSDEVAEEVLELEARMDVLQLKARMALLMAARSPEDAEQLAPVLGVVGAAEKISDAAGDIAKVVLEDIGLPEAMRAALPEAIETLIRATVVPESSLAGRSLGDENLATRSGVRVVAVRRDGGWLTDPDGETVVRAGDVLMLRGTDESMAGVYREVTGEEFVATEAPEPAIEDLERAVDSIVLMKNMSELAVDLAYGAVLFDSTEVAEEVLELEAEVDALESRFEAWVLRAAARVDDPVSLRGLVHLAGATEVISDAALEISEGVLRGMGTHPVVAAAVEESDEVIVRLAVQQGSPLDGATLASEMVKTETGMRVIAVRRGHDGGGGSDGDAGGGSDGDATVRNATDGDASGVDATDGDAIPGSRGRGRSAVGRAARGATARDSGDWVVAPGPDTRLRAGDVLIAKGTDDGADRLERLAGDQPDAAS